MTQEEFYIWLLNCSSWTLPEFNPEFLKNYEIAKLVLDKFGIHYLSENQQRILNPEAVSNWFRVSEYIKLEYDIPEILELLPERIVGNLILSYSQIESLPKIEVVGWNLYLQHSKIKSLPELKTVGYKIYVLFSKESYWKKYFRETERTDLAIKVKAV